MNLRGVARRAVLTGIVGAVVLAVSGCAQMELTDLKTVFIDKQAAQKVKRDGLGNPLIPKS
jgi:hypothetical protein